jgi:ABC-type nitrate/sulfonate/bicarbonate transport system ATPase subunit
MTAEVRVSGLTHRYETRVVLDELNLTALDGELVAVVGPTGCGKSTLLRILAGLVTPSSGAATIAGRSAIATPGLAAYMPQGDTLLPWRTALQNASLGALIARHDVAASTIRARALFARFGLLGFEDAWPSELSGGMRQRVALLRTVLVNRPVVLLDEPFGALDQLTRVDLQGWLADLLAEAPRTTLLVTHDVDEALRLADVVVVLSPRPGRVVDLIRIADPRPRHPDRLTRQDFVMLKRRLLASLQPA